MDWNDLYVFTNASIDIIISHHSIEHAGCGEAAGFVRESWRVLKPGGSLIVFVPDLRALAQRWLLGQVSTQVYKTNVFGPFDGTEGSRHRWGYDRASLNEFLIECAPWKEMKSFDWREIEGANVARDWHVLAMEAVK